MQAKELKIAVISDRNPRDRKSQSGVFHYMSLEFERCFGGVEYIYPQDLEPHKKSFAYLWRYYYARLVHGTYYSHTWSVSFAKYLSGLVSRELEKLSVDALVVLHAPSSIAYLRPEARGGKPIVFVHDATFDCLADYYLECGIGCVPMQRREGHAVETLGIQQSDMLVYSTDWAARSAVEKYGARPESIRVLQRGANIDARFIPQSVEPFVEKRLADPVFRLLMVGKDWQRKGGDIARAALRELNARGVPVELTFVGFTPPADFAEENARFVGFLDKNQPEGLRHLADLYAQSHALVLPTRAECTAIVYNEAAAFGLPCLTTDTGGVASAILPEVNGLLFTPQEGGREYADAIQALHQDRERYARMARTARKEYETRLNWTHWGDVMADTVAEAVRGRS